MTETHHARIDGKATLDEVELNEGSAHCVRLLRRNGALIRQIGISVCQLRLLKASGARFGALSFRVFAGRFLGRVDFLLAQHEQLVALGGPVHANDVEGVLRREVDVQTVVPSQRAHQHRPERAPEREASVAPGQHNGASVRRPPHFPHVARRAREVFRTQHDRVRQLEAAGEVVDDVDNSLGAAKEKGCESLHSNR